MKRYWLSWYQKADDYRPLTDPPNAGILGWWKTGENAFGHATLCALVSAASEDEAWAAVGIDWPEGERAYRFSDEVESDWEPNDRFIRKGWMRERLSHRPAARDGR